MITEKLRKRSDLASVAKSEDKKQIEADSEATGMVMHKDSKWSQSWQNFKDNNQYMNSKYWS